MNIVDILKNNRPTLSDTSLKTYKSNIKKTLELTEKKYDSLKDIEENFKEIFEILMEYPFNVRKTKMSAFIVLLDEKDDNTKERVEILEDLRNVMFEDAKKYNNDENKQELSKSQKENFVEWTEVLKKQKELEKIAKPLLKLDKLKKKHFNVLVEYVLHSCYTLIAPRRAKDYAEFYLRDFDLNKQNYMLSTKQGKKRKTVFIFNAFKNASRLGTQEIPIPNTLYQIITKWSKLNKTPYLIPTYTGMPVTQTKINQIINRIYDGKKVGPSMLRHSYLTHSYSNVDLLKLQEDTENMGNKQISRTLKYVNKDVDDIEEKKELISTIN